MTLMKYRQMDTIGMINRRIAQIASGHWWRACGCRRNWTLHIKHCGTLKAGKKCKYCVGVLRV